MPRNTPSRPPATATPSARVPVLVISAQPLLRLGLDRLLRRQPEFHLAAETASYEGALAEALRLRPAITILDLQAAGTRAAELIHRLTALTAGRVLVLHDRMSTLLLARLRQAGAATGLAKSSRLEDLLSVLRSLLQEPAAPPAEEVNSAPPLSPFAALTSREQELLGLLAHGLGYRDAALRMRIGERTAKIQLSRILRKLQLRNRIEAIRYAHQHQLVGQWY